ncbi:MAG: hypothetical protein PHO67_08105 [Candidatus Omnitrophica bacterium]|nr:hypothetical protein [Candidatus Omnitrophota bacterium]
MNTPHNQHGLGTAAAATICTYADQTQAPAAASDTAAVGAPTG